MIHCTDADFVGYVGFDSFIEGAGVSTELGVRAVVDVQRFVGEVMHALLQASGSCV